MSLNERVQLNAIFFYSFQYWKSRHIDLKSARIVYLRNQAAIRERGRIAKAKGCILVARGNNRFERLKPLLDPVPHPLVLGFI